MVYENGSWFLILINTHQLQLLCILILQPETVQLSSVDISQYEEKLKSPLRLQTKMQNAMEVLDAN